VLVEVEDASRAAELAADGLRDVEDIDVQIKERDEDACESHHLWQDGCAASNKNLRERVEGGR
jgi:hypothetical protein